MKTLQEQIEYIFSIHYSPDCHPSRSDDVKAQEAILLIAKKVDDIEKRVAIVENMFPFKLPT